MSNDRVKEYWEYEACGTHSYITKTLKPLSAEWFREVVDYRKKVEPFIDSAARFIEMKGQDVLEIGVGAGVDHVEIAKNAGNTYGVDLTEMAISVTKAHLECNGLESQLEVADAEKLPFKSSSFDQVWSWGVIHHSDRTEKVVDEIYRVLKPGGTFKGMIYNRQSLAVYYNWLVQLIRHGKIYTDLDQLIAREIESSGTTAYTLSTAHQLFSKFVVTGITNEVTVSDHQFPLSKILTNLVPNLGWYWVFECRKE